ncbi:MAG: sensor histidine kinase [Promethearchaeota archaeon]
MDKTKGIFTSLQQTYLPTALDEKNFHFFFYQKSLQNFLLSLSMILTALLIAFASLDKKRVGMTLTILMLVISGLIINKFFRLQRIFNLLTIACFLSYFYWMVQLDSISLTKYLGLLLITAPILVNLKALNFLFILELGGVCYLILIRFRPIQEIFADIIPFFFFCYFIGRMITKMLSDMYSQEEEKMHFMREIADEKRLLLEQRYSALFNNMIDGSALHKVVFDATGHPIDYVYVDINPAFTQMLGLTREMVIGKKVSEVIPGIREDPTNLIQELGNVALNNKTISIEFNFEPLQKNFAVTAYCPEKEYFVTIFRDITLNLKLEKEREKLMYILNERVKELQCLNKFTEISEKSASIKEFLAALLVEIPKAWQYPSSTYAKIVFKDQSYKTPNYHPTRWVLKEDIVINEKKLGKFEVGYLEKKPDEDEGPFFVEERNLAKMLVEQINQFIERRQAEAELSEASKQEKLYQKQLKAASQFKSEFMASMSHELRTPLNSIIGFTDVVLERISGEINPEQEQFLKNVKSSGLHLLDLINDILDIVKIESGKVELHIVEVNLSQIIDQIKTMIKPMYEKKKLVLEIQIIDKETVIRVDRLRFKEILFNLLSNAVKYTQDGVVKVEFLEGETQWKFDVVDTGIGIKEEDHYLIFQEFKRIQSAHVAAIQGTGLGLSLTKKLIELHGGTLSFTSKFGVGSTFTFTIPKIAISKS